MIYCLKNKKKMMKMSFPSPEKLLSFSKYSSSYPIVIYCACSQIACKEK